MVTTKLQKNMYHRLNYLNQHRPLYAKCDDSRYTCLRCQSHHYSNTTQLKWKCKHQTNNINLKCTATYAAITNEWLSSQRLLNCLSFSTITTTLAQEQLIIAMSLRTAPLPRARWGTVRRSGDCRRPGRWHTGRGRHSRPANIKPERRSKRDEEGRGARGEGRDARGRDTSDKKYGLTINIVPPRSWILCTRWTIWWVDEWVWVWVKQNLRREKKLTIIPASIRSKTIHIWNPL